MLLQQVPNFKFTSSLQWDNSSIYMWAPAEVPYWTRTLSLAALEGEEYMKLEKRGNNNNRKYFSYIYIATVLLKPYCHKPQRGMYHCLVCNTLPWQSFACWFQLFLCRLGGFSASSIQYLYMLYIFHNNNLRTLLCVTPI